MLERYYAIISFLDYFNNLVLLQKYFVKKMQ